MATDPPTDVGANAVSEPVSTDAKRRRISETENTTTAQNDSATATSPSSEDSNVQANPMNESDSNGNGTITAAQNIASKKVGYQWYHEVMGSPKSICSPMVDQSELPFRLLCLDHGTDICYTPMINSKMLVQSVDMQLWNELVGFKPAKTWNSQRWKPADGRPSDGPDVFAADVEEMIAKMDTNAPYFREWTAYNNEKALAEWEKVCADAKKGINHDKAIDSALPAFVKEWSDDGSATAMSTENVEASRRSSVVSIASNVSNNNSSNNPNGSVSNKFLEREFSTSSRERGKVVAQFCGDNPAVVLAGARLIENYVDAIDLNCGCPQGIAKKGHYGSYLLEEPDLICSIVRALTIGLKNIPVTVKIRKVNSACDYADTLKLIDNLVLAGASAITIHCRTKEEKGQHVKEADWPVAKIIKERVKSKEIPVFCNGGIENYDDFQRCLEFTTCDAVMSAEALLEDVQVFSPRESEGRRLPQDEIFRQYLAYARRCDTRLKIVKAHAFHFLYAGLQTFTDLRAKVGQAASIEDIERVVCGPREGGETAAEEFQSIRERRVKWEKEQAEQCEAEKSFPNLGWYRRYRNPIGGKVKKEKE